MPILNIPNRILIDIARLGYLPKYFPILIHKGIFN